MDTPLEAHLLRRDAEHAGLRGHDQEVVRRYEVAAGPEAVTVEDRADLGPVRANDQRRAVPGLHQGRVVFIEVALGLVHRDVVRPGLGDHHQHRVRQRPPGCQQQLEGIVEAGGVTLYGRAAGRDYRQELLNGVAQLCRGEHRGAGGHPVDVAAQGVDLAVMNNVAIRVRQAPAAQGVGAETRVHQGEGRHEGLVRQVVVEGLDLVGDQQALVDQTARRQAADVEVLFLLHIGVGDGLLDDLSRRVKLELEPVLVRSARGPAHEELAYHRHHVPRHHADRPWIHRDIAPAQELETLGLDLLLDQRLAAVPLVRVLGQEGHADGVLARVRQVDFQPRALFTEEVVGHLHGDAGAVTGLGIGPAGAAMPQVDQDLEPLLDDLVRLVSLDICDQANAAGVMLELRVVKALLFQMRNIPLLRLLLCHGYDLKGDWEDEARRSSGTVRNPVKGPAGGGLCLLVILHRCGHWVA